MEQRHSKQAAGKRPRRRVRVPVAVSSRTTTALIDGHAMSNVAFLCPLIVQPHGYAVGAPLTITKTRHISQHSRVPRTPRTRRAVMFPSALVESDISRDVPEPLLRAVESLSSQPRQTVADIAAKAGLPIDTAALDAASLAALTAAAVDVTDSGDLAYRFPSNVRARLRAKSLRARLRMAWDAVAPRAFAAARVAFGALLIVSIVLTFLAIAVLSSAARSNDDDRGGSSRSVGLPMRIFAPDIFDIMLYNRRLNYYQQNYQQDGRGRGRASLGKSSDQDMSFLEAVFSFVFGDSDPNEDLEARRYRTIAAVIRANNGAVSADQLAPFLNPPSASVDPNHVDEAFVLPVLQRFQGRPEVTDDGDIIYVFPDFLRTGSAVPRVEFAGRVAPKPIVEVERRLTSASAGQRAMVIALGVVNIVGVVTLGVKLGTTIPMSADAAAFLSFVKGIYPALAVYASTFVAVPLARFLRLFYMNKDIRQRNTARAAATDRLVRGGSEVTRKIAAAQKFAQKSSVVRSGDVIYSSDADVVEQQTVQDSLSEDFDRRLRER